MARGKNSNRILYGRTGPRQSFIASRQVEENPIRLDDIDLNELYLNHYFENVDGFSGGVDWALLQEKFSSEVTHLLGKPKTEHEQSEMIIRGIQRVEPLLDAAGTKINFENIPTSKLIACVDGEGDIIGNVRQDPKHFIEWNFRGEQIEWHWLDLYDGDLRKRILATNIYGDIIGWLNLY